MIKRTHHRVSLEKGSVTEVWNKFVVSEEVGELASWVGSPIVAASSYNFCLFLIIKLPIRGGWGRLLELIFAGYVPLAS